MLAFAYFARVAFWLLLLVVVVWQVAAEPALEATRAVDEPRDPPSIRPKESS